MRRTFFPLLLLLVLAAATVGSLSKPAPAQAAAACSKGYFCFFDKAGWKVGLEYWKCGKRPQRTLGEARRRVTSVINNCNHPVTLLDINAAAPTGLRPPSTRIAPHQWLWTLGGARRMDNRATHLRVG